ncbi:hypothetical protein O3G_MSEX004744 [Manduca sexta]|uniref:Uncharacterized protein n=1 Tax=Manduca sexta TaxID=7130 RepID=A0A922CIP3_MANSE|nr:hypothetical protein O3G_MSEX004744 [Manduca sexta]
MAPTFRHMMQQASLSPYRTQIRDSGLITKNINDCPSQDYKTVFVLRTQYNLATEVAYIAGTKTRPRRYYGVLLGSSSNIKGDRDWHKSSRRERKPARLPSDVVKPINVLDTPSQV